MSDEKTKAEEAVLATVRQNGSISPRDLEVAVVQTNTQAREARVAVQRLLEKGDLRVDSNLKLVAEASS